jgi:trk system potassium uptake protein TrkA
MKIIIVGCGRMGAALAQDLIRRGHGVAVVDKEPAAFERLVPWFTGETVAGIGFDRTVLLQAGIELADGLAAVTDSDETNVVTARAAKQFFRVPKVVARLYDPRKAEIYRRLGVQTISQVTWGVNRVVELLCYSRLETLISLGSGEVDIVETELPQLLAGRPVAEVTVPGEITVVAISRQGKTFMPTPSTEMLDGDMIHLAILVASGDRLKALLGLR